jgi:hypothetical protein
MVIAVGTSKVDGDCGRQIEGTRGKTPTSPLSYESAPTVEDLHPVVSLVHNVNVFVAVLDHVNGTVEAFASDSETTDRVLEIEGNIRRSQSG